MTESCVSVTWVGCQGGVLDMRVQKQAEPFCPCYVLPKGILGTLGAGQPVSPALTQEDRPPARIVWV